MNAIIVRTAASQIGVKEISGDEHNDTIVAYAHAIGLKWINDDETPWCAIFMWWVLMKCGYEYKANAAARSFDDYGTKVLSPEPGDIVVFWRESINSGKGHVGVFLGFSDDKRYVFVLGGNQANSVTISKYGVANVIGYRRASEEVSSLEVPAAPLEKGAKGGEVSKLQGILQYFDLYKGKIDGDFGPNTANAVMAFQIKYNLNRTGVYDNGTKNKFFALLNE